MITLNRAGTQEPADLLLYAELRELFQRLRYADDVKVPWLICRAKAATSAGGDVHEIIGRW